MEDEKVIWLDEIEAIVSPCRDGETQLLMPVHIAIQFAEVLRDIAEIGTDLDVPNPFVTLVIRRAPTGEARLGLRPSHLKPDVGPTLVVVSMKIPTRKKWAHLGPPQKD
jgi:hypothetical protein